MRAAVSAVVVEGRHRIDLGDLDALADSIRRIGLLNPITVTSDFRLVAGERRLEACKRLGWAEVPVRVVDSLADARTLLIAERDENVCREPFKPSEIASIGRALEDVFKPAARERVEAGTADPRVPGPEGRVRDQVGDVLGVSGRTYERIRDVADDAADESLPPVVRESAEQALAALDAGAPVRPTVDAHREVKRTGGLAVHFSTGEDEWATPQEFFDLLDAEFGFDLDVCAQPNSAKCARFFTPDDDGLVQEWSGVCWMNPPYSECARWVEKAHHAAAAGATVVALIPARPDTRYWWDFCRHHEIRFVKGRLKFGGSAVSAPFPSAVVVFGRPARTVWRDHRAALLEVA